MVWTVPVPDLGHRGSSGFPLYRPGRCEISQVSRYIFDFFDPKFMYMGGTAIVAGMFHCICLHPLLASKVYKPSL